MISDDDFKLLLVAVRTIRANMELAYDAFRHTKELNESREILDRLALKHGVPLDNDG